MGNGKWKKPSEFGYRTGEVLVIMPNPRKKEVKEGRPHILREESIGYTEYPKEYVEEHIRPRLDYEGAPTKDMGNGKVRVYSFSRTLWKNVIAMKFKSDILKDFREEWEMVY